MDTHKPKSESTVLFPNFVDFLIREISAKRSAEKKLGSQRDNISKLIHTVNVSKIDACKIANVAVIF